MRVARRPGDLDKVTRVPEGEATGGEDTEQVEATEAAGELMRGSEEETSGDGETIGEMLSLNLITE